MLKARNLKIGFECRYDLLIRENSIKTEERVTRTGKRWQSAKAVSSSSYLPGRRVLSLGTDIILRCSVTVTIWKAGQSTEVWNLKILKYRHRLGIQV